MIMTGRVAPSQCKGTASGSRSCTLPSFRRLRQNRRQYKVRAQTEQAEEVDPITGMPVPKFAATNPESGLKVKVGNMQWAYRQSEVPSGKSDPYKPAVLLLHGIGSSSFCWRNTLGLLGADGYEAYAPDFPGHGDSDKPSKNTFGYTEEEFVAGLDGFVEAVGIKKPMALVVQGYVLSQYGLLWAAQNEDKVARLMILNTPLSLGSKLRPDLAAFKNPIPFLRPKSFDGALFNADGLAYVMEGKVAAAYARPYQDPAALEALSTTLEKLDFQKLLNKVDDMYGSWKQPSIVVFGSSDPFLKVNSAFEFLDTKRTNMKVIGQKAKMGAMPQEDYAEAVHGTMIPFLEGATDVWVSGKMMKMTNKGGVEVD
mmetsp:Transcript_16062/g.43766  ORF Transcript_16062/g.43766 Transcript_16062/m.43766 type:complete len:369 (-) Transcript_16062:507-1613(-)|eukprot:CAMPEP_0202341568 /NCGR_PEP_ID=MMETSP1126-20121109/2508_1 /ASSEMBLY_ACC=CAM_ASM_000457 /TAXON_ID=3047 /ORGANISM="Dunaliella tertiolecta, Strain CCMP1320" /LENGTH=368 /DNA_ID=CAMNT_0048932405 /DNA_START=330 /DNA_END=1436 /DNA_ORIENTATION=-